MMRGAKIRLGMAMIELIFAIVIIAISVMTIPSMMNVANNASRGMIIDEDILKRMTGEITKVSQARWDQNVNAPDFAPLQIAGDLVCAPNPTRGAGNYRANPNSMIVCSDNAPMMAGNPVNGDLNLSRGIEQLHNRNYNIEINSTDGAVYTVPIAYRVSYVTATLTAGPDANGTAHAKWQLGSSANLNPNAVAAATHLKRIVVNVQDNDPEVNMTLTFFKSNVGKAAE
ncbi:MAG: hypothetical protein IE884_06560 [Sulfuricurvum sp.]|nr:hypothetical protein [Sulfuricurvum sp.]